MQHLPDPRWFLPAVMLYALLVAALCSASTITEVELEAWADAIYKAENSVNHPYGIMLAGCDKDHSKFCRKACMQTIYNTLIKYRAQRCAIGETDISCLSRRYCPINSDTDSGTCQYWSKNVNYYLKKGK